MRFEKLVAPCVISLLIDVPRTIDLNNHQRIEASKVCNVSTQRMLTPKFNAQLFTTYFLPEQSFAVAHFSAK